MKCALFLAEGFEECEALIVVDLFRRTGVMIDTVSITSQKMVLSSHQIGIQADKILDEIKFDEYDVLILPGGKLGTQNLEKCSPLMSAYKNHLLSGKLTCAICAAPSILGHLGLLKGKRFTCFPGFEENGFSGTYENELTVQDDNLITGRGMGATIAFALLILKNIVDEETIKKVQHGIQYEHTFRQI